MTKFPSKFDYYHAEAGGYLFSKNDLDTDLVRAMEVHGVPVRVYRTSLLSKSYRHDRRNVRHETIRTGSADGHAYYKGPTINYVEVQDAVARSYNEMKRQAANFEVREWRNRKADGTPYDWPGYLDFYAAKYPWMNQ